MANFDQNCVDMKRRSSKSKQLTLNQRNGILKKLLRYKKGEKLQHGAIHIVAADFEVSRLTVSKIWHIAKRQYSEGQISADVKLKLFALFFVLLDICNYFINKSF